MPITTSTLSVCAPLSRLPPEAELFGPEDGAPYSDESLLRPLSPLTAQLLGLPPGCGMIEAVERLQREPTAADAAPTAALPAAAASQDIDLDRLLRESEESSTHGMAVAFAEESALPASFWSGALLDSCSTAIPS